MTVIGYVQRSAEVDGTWYPFEEYLLKDGLVDWTKTNPKHVCIKIDHKAHAGSHKQLWVLFNASETLHNFHIHQMKFRLATRKVGIGT